MQNIILPYYGVERATQIGLMLSTNLHNVNFNNIENEKLNLLKQVNCQSFDEYLQKIKQITGDNNYSLQRWNKIKEIKDITILKSNKMKEYLKLMKIFQKVIGILLLQRNIYNIPIYLPCFMDNRGRQYYSTLLSPTFYKSFRFLYEFYEKKKNL